MTRLHIPNYADVRDLFVTCTNRLVVFSDMNAPEGPQLQVWQMNGRKFKEVYSKQYVAFLTRMRRPVEMDDRYISFGAFYRERSEVSEIHFMSTETMKVERTLSVKTTRYRYESGLFFYVTGNVIWYVS